MSDDKLAENLGRMAEDLMEGLDDYTKDLLRNSVAAMKDSGTQGTAMNGISAAVDGMEMEDVHAAVTVFMAFIMDTAKDPDKTWTATKTVIDRIMSQNAGKRMREKITGELPGALGSMFADDDSLTDTGLKVKRALQANLVVVDDDDTAILKRDDIIHVCPKVMNVGHDIQDIGWDQAFAKCSECGDDVMYRPSDMMNDATKVCLDCALKMDGFMNAKHVITKGSLKELGEFQRKKLN